MTAKLSIPPHNLAFIRHWHWKANERHRSNNTTGCSKWPSSSGSPLLMDCVACTPASWLRPVANCRKKNDLPCYLSSFCQFLQLNLAMCSLSPGHQISQYLATTSPGYPWFPSRLPENTVRKPCLASALSLDPWSGTLTGCRLIVMQGGPWKPSCIFW